LSSAASTYLSTVSLDVSCVLDEEEFLVVAAVAFVSASSLMYRVSASLSAIINSGVTVGGRPLIRARRCLSICRQGLAAHNIHGVLVAPSAHPAVLHTCFSQGLIGTGKMAAGARHLSSSIEEGNELRNNLLGHLFHEPMPSTRDDDTLHVRRHKLPLAEKHLARCPFPGQN
jgi:hypothetical protein